jgi:hypothetical protein
LHARLDSVEGRKLRMSATMEDPFTHQVQVESTTLFINMKLSMLEQFMYKFSKWIS